MAFLEQLFDSFKAPTNATQATQALQLLNGTASRQRRISMQKRMDYYYDKQEQYLKDMLLKQFKQPERINLQKEFDNITRFIVDEIAVLYNEPPFREIQEGSAQDIEIYDEIIKGSQFDIMMQQANRFTKLFKTAIMRPVWRNNSIQYDIYTPNMFDVFQDVIDPTIPIGVVWCSSIDLFNEILLNNDDKRGAHDKFDESNLVFYYLDAQSFIVFSLAFSRSGEIISKIHVNQQNESNINPYGVLPFVTLRDGVPIGKYFLEGGDDLIATNEAINVKLTELNYLTKMQAFSIPVRKGADDRSGSITLDPSLTIDLPADDDQSRNADFKFVSPDAKIEELEKTIDAKKARISIKYGISLERFTASAQKSSAQALQLRAFDQARVIKADKPLWFEYEKQLFDMTRIIWNHHNPDRQISQGAKLFVDYKETEVPTTQEDEDQHNLLLFNNGLQSKRQWLMKENPDLRTEKQAEEALKEIGDEKLEEQKATQARIQDLSPGIPGTDVVGEESREDEIEDNEDDV